MDISDLFFWTVALESANFSLKQLWCCRAKAAIGNRLTGVPCPNKTLFAKTCCLQAITGRPLHSVMFLISGYGHLIDFVPLQIQFRGSEIIASPLILQKPIH